MRALVRSTNPAPTRSRSRGPFILLTVGAGKLQPAAMQPVDYMQRAWRRSAAFLEDHACLDSLP